MTRLPLDLYVEVQSADGTRYRWDANQAPGSRLRNFSFRTKVGDGFSDAAGQLARRIDRNYPDLDLVNSVTVVGADGSVAYEGRIEAMPRELTDTHSIGVTMAGWMAHAKDRKFTEVYVDRDLGGWGSMSNARRGVLLGANRMPIGDSQQNTDPASSTAVISTGFTGAWATPYRPISEAWYDAGPGLTVGKLGYSWARAAATVDNTDAQWDWAGFVSTSDSAVAGSGTGSLRAAGPATLQTYTPATPGRYAMLQLVYNLTAGGAAGVEYAINWSKLAVYGNHGLSGRDGEPGEPQGVYASDVLRNIGTKWCPKLDIRGITDSSYVIQHLVFKDPVFPYDAMLELNKFHLWHLGVWENRLLTFRPYDFRDYQWEIRTDDPGTTFSPQGPTTENLWNGICVTYKDVLTGVVNRLTPETNSELADTSISNPWNEQKIPRWDEIALSTPTTQATALQIGRAALGENNRPKAPGTITVKGYIRDRAGIEQPVWKVRAGDTIAITNFPNDSPRLIVETDYDDNEKGLKIAVDRPFRALDAIIDRLGSAAGARGLA
jgi:hypothetical protein